MGDTVRASYLHNLVSNKTTVVAEIAHKLSKNENTFTIGSSYALDSFTTVKGRANNYGKVAALVQHEWRPKSTLTLSAEIDSKALDKQTKFGLAVALKP
jgi:voltage-dependent anion channel protein 2